MTAMGKVAVFAGMLTALLCAGPTFGDDEVILKSRRFTPAVGVSESLRAGAGRGAERIHVILQLEGVATVERRAGFVKAGVRLLSYVPNRAWLAGVRADAVDEIAALPGVRTVTEIRPEDKLAPALREEGVSAYAIAAAGQARLTALLFRDVALDTGIRTIEHYGGTVIQHSAAENSVAFHLPMAAIDDLAACDCVKWIDQFCASMDLNDGVRAAVNINAVQLSPYNLTGTNVVIGQWESKHPDGTHADLSERVTNVNDAWPVGDHATQVAGTMIGSGRLLPNRQYRGIATNANIVSYHSWDTVSDLRAQYDDAIRMHNIDIANNSWGKVEWHIYKDYAAALDRIVRGELGKPISMVWAAGNEGGWGTILCTGVAKNVVTVGATNSDDHTLWAWSNKGPTEDGRVKPDLVAPGCESDGGSIWSTLPAPSYYGGACGTSLAAPSVSGTMALILEDWRATHGSDPLPATIKAILLHTARDLGNPGPDYVYGYGLIDGKRSIDLVRADTLDDTIVEDMVLQQGQRDSYTLELAPATAELKVTLVWDDWPADPLAAHALVNDLDLVVTGPDGRRYYPWTLDPAEPNEPAQQTRTDHTNNVEQISVAQPQAGTWLVTVWAANLPQHHQPYSLVTDGTGFGQVLSGTAILGIVGHLGQTVAEFDDAGDLILQGALTTGTQCDPPAGAFVINGPQQQAVGYIDLDGNMCIRGELNELSHCEMTGGGFIVKDWFGSTVAYVDMFGNLCLAGRLHQNPQP
jgi:hypothetical protein